SASVASAHAGGGLPVSARRRDGFTASRVERWIGDAVAAAHGVLPFKGGAWRPICDGRPASLTASTPAALNADNGGGWPILGVVGVCCPRRRPRTYGRDCCRLGRRCKRGWGGTACK